MSSENASNGTVQMKIEMILDKGKVKIKGRGGFSVDLKSPVLKVSELYNAVFTDITQPTNIIVTASNDVLQSREAKPIFENIKTIVDNAIEEINSGLIELAESENNQDDDETKNRSETK